MQAISADGSISRTTTTDGLATTMAHVHMGAPVWSDQPDTKLSAEQLTCYCAGRLYVNGHTETNKCGKIQAQLKP